MLYKKHTVDFYKRRKVYRRGSTPSVRKGHQAADDRVAFECYLNIIIDVFFIMNQYIISKTLNLKNFPLCNTYHPKSMKKNRPSNFSWRVTMQIRYHLMVLTRYLWSAVLTSGHRMYY